MHTLHCFLTISTSSMRSSNHDVCSGTIWTTNCKMVTLLMRRKWTRRHLCFILFAVTKTQCWKVMKLLVVYQSRSEGAIHLTRISTQTPFHLYQRRFFFSLLHLGRITRRIFEDNNTTQSCSTAGRSNSKETVWRLRVNPPLYLTTSLSHEAHIYIEFSIRITSIFHVGIRIQRSKYGQ